MVNLPGHKRCPKCGETKTLNEYHYSNTTKNKKQVYCKICMRLMDKLKRDKISQNGPTIIRTEKMCLDCNVIKNISEFGLRKNAPDWHLSYCKPCWVKKIKKYQQKSL